MTCNVHRAGREGSSINLGSQQQHIMDCTLSVDHWIVVTPATDEVNRPGGTSFANRLAHLLYQSTTRSSVIGFLADTGRHRRTSLPILPRDATAQPNFQRPSRRAECVR